VRGLFEERKAGDGPGGRMKKVEIIVSDYGLGLENKINDFLSDHNVTGIQYQMSASGDCGMPIFSAMIVYEEEQKEEPDD
jgi:hypothetical protein